MSLALGIARQVLSLNVKKRLVKICAGRITPVRVPIKATVSRRPTLHVYRFYRGP
ncbi:hypothetical protein SOJ17_000700 [Metallosphaera sedula DSM 5348]|uniref:hypothetical protein n=1 Tax=Metallosphaera sedula TaxID=43687 RepID=UPI001F162AF6|nr:hypothetical protein [Metallosphaera sedula]WPX06961.1 hypothetical protein SOJ17_000700 [Metallosphaera sedula DSM 5348]